MIKRDNIFKSKNITLLRVVNSKTRYYKIIISKTLFDDTLLERVYGSTYNRSYTGIKKEYFKEYKNACIRFKNIVESKIKKGYRIW